TDTSQVVPGSSPTAMTVRRPRSYGRHVLGPAGHVVRRHLELEGAIMTMFSKRWATLGAITGLAGVLILASMQVQADELSSIAASSGRFLAGNLLTFVGTALIGSGLLAVGHACAGHGHRVASVLSRVAGVGWLLHTALIAPDGVSYELALMPDRAAAAALEEKIYAGPVFIGLLLPMLTLSVIGTIGAGVALW